MEGEGEGAPAPRGALPRPRSRRRSAPQGRAGAGVRLGCSLGKKPLGREKYRPTAPYFRKKNNKARRFVFLP